jgi:hypothetical protein
MAVYEELIHFLATELPSEKLAAFQPTEETKQRLADLIHREKTEELTTEEKSELDHYLHLEHVIRMVKAKAQLQS